MTYTIAAIPGDGIGLEVLPEGLRALSAAADVFDLDVNVESFDFASCDYHQEHGQMMPDDWSA